MCDRADLRFTDCFLQFSNPVILDTRRAIIHVLLPTSRVTRYWEEIHLPASSIGDSTVDDRAVNEDVCCVIDGMPATQQVGGNVLAEVEDVTAVCCCCCVWTIA